MWLMPLMVDLLSHLTQRNFLNDLKDYLDISIGFIFLDVAISQNYI